ncbi:MAG: PAS domain-containing protein [Hymenobacter sp.]
MTESLPSTSFTVDQAGQVLYISPQWYAYTGMEPGADVTAAWPQLIHPDDLPAVAEQHGAALAERRPLGLRVSPARGRRAVPLVCQPGRARAAGRGRSRRPAPPVVRLQPRHRRLEAGPAAARRKDQLLTSILSSLPASVVTFEGEDLRFGFFNATYQRRVQGRAVLGRPAGRSFPKPKRRASWTSLREVLRTGEPYQAQEVPAYDPRPAHRAATGNVPGPGLPAVAPRPAAAPRRPRLHRSTRRTACWPAGRPKPPRPWPWPPPSRPPPSARRFIRCLSRRPACIALLRGGQPPHRLPTTPRTSSSSRRGAPGPHHCRSCPRGRGVRASWRCSTACMRPAKPISGSRCRLSRNQPDGQPARNPLLQLHLPTL